MAGRYLSLGEFIAECKTFPYTQEHYDMLLEAYDIDLRWTYVEGMNFQRSSEYYLYESMMDGYPSEYFHEYEEYISEAEAAESKSMGFFAKMGKFFRDLGNKFVKFISNLGARCSSIEVLKDEASQGGWYKHTWSHHQIIGIGKYLKIDFRKWKDFELVGENVSHSRSLKFESDVPDDVRAGFTKFLNAMLVEGISIKDEDAEALLQKTKDTVVEKVNSHPYGQLAMAVGVPIVVNKGWLLGSDFIIKKFNDFRTNNYGDEDLKASNEALSAFYNMLREEVKKRQEGDSKVQLDQFEEMMKKINNYERNHSSKDSQPSADDLIGLYKYLFSVDPPENIVELLRKVDERRATLKQQDEQNSDEQNKAKKLADKAVGTVRNAMNGSVGNVIAQIATDYKKEIGGALAFGSGILMLKRWKAVTRKRINEFVQGKFDNSQEENDEDDDE